MSVLSPAAHIPLQQTPVSKGDAAEMVFPRASAIRTVRYEIYISDGRIKSVYYSLLLVACIGLAFMGHHQALSLASIEQPNSAAYLPVRLLPVRDEAAHAAQGEQLVVPSVERMRRLRHRGGGGLAHVQRELLPHGAAGEYSADHHSNHQLCFNGYSRLGGHCVHYCFLCGDRKHNLQDNIEPSGAAETPARHSCVRAIPRQPQ